MCVLINGKPAKELANGVVKIPFGEYALRFRNKNNRRALVKITIDGEDAGGCGYIIPANDYIDIERWSSKPVKFKFVSLDSEDAVDFGKNGPNEDKVKGTIESRFYLEKEAPKPLPVEHHHHHHHYPKPTPIYPTPIYPPYYPPYCYTSGTVTTSGTTYSSGSGVNYSSDSLQGGVNYSSESIKVGSSDPDIATFKRISIPLKRRGLGGAHTVSGQSMSFCSAAPSTPSAETYYSAPTPAPVQDGCTVEGNYSSQNFRTVWFDAEEDYVALKIFLQGFDEVKHVAQPIRSRETVKSKKLRELEEENRRLKAELERQEREDAEAEVLSKLEEENRKLRESLGESS